MKTVYTCTDNPQRIEAYRKGKPIVDRKLPTIHDLGDFGAGLYASDRLKTSQFYGRQCFRMVVDKNKFLKLQNPYDFTKIPGWLRDTLFSKRIVFDHRGKPHRQMKTIALSPSGRKKAAYAVKNKILGKGFCGAYWPKAGEYVVFSDRCLRSIEEI